MKVEEAFQSGLIPKEYIGIVPFKCKCGADNEVSDTLTRMWCPSNRCYNKQIARMNKMLTAFDVKGIGEEYCRSLWNKMEMVDLEDSYVNVFKLKLSDYPDDYGEEVTKKKFNSIQAVVMESIYSGGYSFGEVVSNLCLPGLDNNAKRLFQDFDGLKDFIGSTTASFGKYGVYKYVSELFGYGVLTDQIVSTISEFAHDILIAEKLFLIREPVSVYIQIAMTGKVSNAGSFTRKEFVKYCNEICYGKAEIIEAGASSKTKFVIADFPSDSSKYNYGQSKGILITSDKFIEYLKQEVI